MNLTEGKFQNSEPECSCNYGCVCEDHPESALEHDDCGGAGEAYKNPNCNKDPDTIFATVHRCSLKD